MSLVWLLAALVSVATLIPVVRQLRDHPRGLVVLFGLEMWERFSYYGLRALLIFYLTQHLLFDDGSAQAHYAAYTALAYLLPLVGGLIADRLLGPRAAVAFGAVLLVCGHGLMAVEAPQATQVLHYRGASYALVAGSEGAAGAIEVARRRYDLRLSPNGIEAPDLPIGSPLPRVMPKGTYELAVAHRSPTTLARLFLALALVATGVGFLKPNVSALVGRLYGPHDPRRDQGFTLYYYGINLGAFWAAIVCGWLGETLGWWAGFGAAGVGMALGFATFLFGRHWLPQGGEGLPGTARPVTRGRTITGYLLGLAVVALAWLLQQDTALVGPVLALATFGAAIFLLVFLVREGTAQDWRRLGFAGLLVLASVVFWVLNEQAGSSLNQFAARNTQLALPGGGAVTPAQTQSINGAFLLIGAPLFAWIWTWLSRIGREPSPLAKFGLALGQAGLAFLLLGLSAPLADATLRVPLAVLAAAYLLLATGELCLSPVGLSQISRLAPPALSSSLLAIWYLSQSWAQWLGGKLAGLTAAQTVGGRLMDPAGAFATTLRVFRSAGWAALAIGSVVLLATLAIEHRLRAEAAR